MRAMLFAGNFVTIGLRQVIVGPGRSPIATAYQWATRIIVVALEMVLPGMAGLWVDKQIGTVVLFMLIGFGFGCTGAVIHLIQMTRADAVRKSKD